MDSASPIRTEVWAKLLLSRQDTAAVRSFFAAEFGIPTRRLVRKPHLTLYHCRRPMPGLQECCEPVQLVVPSADTHFMVMCPGGENPRPDIPAFRS